MSTDFDAPLSPDGSRPLHTAAGVPRCRDGTGRHMFIGCLVGLVGW